MTNYYKLDEPSIISFSGGRTSGFMLHEFLKHNNGLPNDCRVMFANTGKEDEATLEFVRDCENNWGVNIDWVEYDPENKYKIVNFENASRNGEPFEALIRKKKYLPNPVTRFCTIEMKIRAMAKYVVDLGLADKQSHAENMAIIGIRADEPRRAAKIADKSRIPLFNAGIKKQDISSFWKAQNFDLKLPNNNGVTMHGNCDLCFLKGGNQIQSLINEKPERAIWWAKMETLVRSENVLSHEGTAHFRKDRPSYQQMFENSQDQKMFDFGDESIGCFCGD